MGFGKDGKGQILYDQTILDVGSLAQNDVANIAVKTELIEDFRIIKTEYFFYYLPGSTDGLEGPLTVGMAAGGLTAAEIEECVEARPGDITDAPSSERVMRAVWPLEGLMALGVSENGPGSRIIAQGEFNPRWTMPNPGGWSFFAYNQGAALAAGGLIYIFAKYYGVWVR